MKSIIDFLRDTIGLDHETIGPLVINSAIKKHMQKLEIENEQDYLSALQSSPIKTKELIELVVVNETWFFRQPEAFNYLRTIANKKRKLLNKQNRLSILCLGCATGEEPYSIAITLRDMGIKSEQFMIDAVDISENALKTAVAASYGKSSFDKQDDLSHINAHFVKTDEIYTLNEQLRNCVTFIHGNILHQTCPLNATKYDIIFCRHVMIYLCDNAKEMLLKQLNKLLAEEGIIFIGASETSVLRNNGYSTCKAKSAFAFKKKSAPPTNDTKDTALSRGASKRRNKARQSANTLFPETRPQSTELDHDSTDDTPDYCWLSIGISGDRSCEKLEQYIRCYNCPVRIEQGRNFLKERLPEEYRNTEESDLALEEEPQNTSPKEHVVIFRLDKEFFALPSLSIKDIAGLSEIHSIPYRSNKVLLGMSNFSGELRLCVSLAAILTNENCGETQALDQGAYERMVTLEESGETWSFRVDEIIDITYIHESEITPVPSQDIASSTYSRGSTTADDRIVNILDLQLLIESLRRSIK